MIKNISETRITSKNSVRLLSIALLAVFFLLSFFVDISAQKANFSGTWTFNETKSNLGDAGGFRRPAKQLTIKQEGNNFSVDRVRTNRDGEETTTQEKYTLDGKECSNTISMGSFQSTSKSVLTWSADGKALTISLTRSFERNGETMERKSSEVLKLTDTKTLSILTTSPSRDGGETKSTIVYDKK